MRSFEHLKYKTVIEKYLKELQVKFVEEYPDKVEYGFRNVKIWKDDHAECIPKVPISPSKALKIYHNKKEILDNIETVSKKVIKKYNI